MIAELIRCASLTAVDSDTVRLGHRHAGDRIAREVREGTKRALIAKGRLKALLTEKGAVFGASALLATLAAGLKSVA
jgi:molybdopterin/thiamine biosynthesis adenylyltransferase